MRSCKTFLLLLCLSLFLTACNPSSPSKKIAAANLDDAGLSRLAKSDIDEVIEIHQQNLMHDLKELMVKLYRRNPSGRYDKGKRTIQESVDLIFSKPYYVGFSEWKKYRGTELIHLAFSDDYQGRDRVLPFILGLRRMLMASYGNETEFYITTSSLDEQKLYNSARNIEIAAWQLSERRNKDGRLFIKSDSVEKEKRNLSFQRLIGRMIATQDNLAAIISHKEGRLIKTVVVKAASMVFLPI
jgi:hypothetical protein